MVHPDPAGYEPLRRSIAAYLGISRGIACTPAQVFVTNGYRGALQLACRALLEPGDEGWYEDPGYPYARRLLEDEGMRLAPVAVDEEGLDVGQGIRRAARARFAVVTPTHQSPLGMALSLPRRLELLEWAGRSAAWIVEDDYDSEFRYHGRPLPALKSLDAQGRVLYAGTFSKALFPGLRLAYLVAPQAQAARLQEAAQRLPGPGAVPLQAAVADFMDQGHFARHLRRMRALYAVRRGFLVDALDAVFGGRLHVQPQAGGIHVLAHLAGRRSDRAIAAEARARGLAVQALSDWRIRKSAAGGLLLGFANLQSADEARAQAERLRAAFDAAR
nr:PLP-dependent aminotransferase family protein [Achromobacter sp. DMS1]